MKVDESTRVESSMNTNCTAVLGSKVGFAHDVRFACIADAIALCRAYAKAPSCRSAKVYLDNGVEVFDIADDAE